MASDAFLNAAAREWLAVSGKHIGTEEIELLRRGRDTTVYRLHSHHGPVIAKCCPTATGKIERTVYEELLTKLSMPTLRYHGSAVEAGGACYWLFVEDAAGERYEPHCEAHRIAAARWLAALHYSVEPPAVGESLPHHGPDYYRQLLTSVLEMLRSHQSEFAKRGTDRRVHLDKVVNHCARLYDVWNEIAKVCRSSQDTLVHGDIVTHNVRIRSTPAGLVFLPFDWEKAGWGSAAEDLSSVDLETYCDCLIEQGVDTNRAAIKRLAGAGKAFRCLVFLQWLGPDLSADSRDAFEQLQMCQSWLDTIMEESPWIS